MSTVISNLKPKATRNHPPGPRGNWLWGVMKQFQADPLQAMIAMWHDYGDAVRFKAFGPYHGYTFTHPEHNHHILQNNNRNYTKLPHPSMNVLVPIVGKGLLTNDGEDWRRQRRLAQPAFHRRRIANLATTMVTVTEQMLAEWDDRQAQGQSELDADAAMMRLTLAIVGQTLFSIDLTREADTVGQHFSVVNEQTSRLTTVPFADILVNIPFLPMRRRLQPHIDALDTVVKGIISQRRQLATAAMAADMPDDLLTLLMQAQDEETNEGMDDHQLRDEVMTIMLAGHETTAVALSWVFYLLDKHPDVREALEAELDKVLNGRSPTMADILNLTYTTMVIEETLRLYPPAYAIARFGQGADIVDGYDLPPKSIITLCPYITHRHPDFWPNPEQFDPERFRPGQQQERPRYAYLPFGGGPRQCIGSNFAMTEAILLLATIAQRYRLQVVPGYQAKTDPMITLRPKGGVPVTLIAR